MFTTVTLEHPQTDAGREALRAAPVLVIGVRPGDSGGYCGTELLDVPEITAHLELLERGKLLPAALGEVTSSGLAVASEPLHLVLVGVGEGDAAGDDYRAAFGAALGSLPEAEAVVLVAPDGSLGALRAACEGALLGSYAYDTAAAAPSHRQRAALTILTPAASDAAAAACVAHAHILAESVAVARDLGNAAPSVLTPAAFAEIVAAAQATDDLAVTVLDDAELRAGGFGGIVGVGQGSVNPPALVRVDYAPANAVTHIAMVGKGITFDSGGLGLKNRAAMLWMKCDMGGAAAVYGAVLAISRMQLPVRVTGWLALAENMPSGTAVKPSDVLRMRNGLTVEVTDTDAEGRLVLADGLAAACEENPDLVLDVATLTGAQIIALGHRTSAIMAPQQRAADAVLRASAGSGEPMWQLPMPAHLKAHLRSGVADLANMGGNDGGVIVGAHFLERFVSETRPWAHLDIAGPAINTEARHGYTPAGATGAGVRTLVQLAVDASAG